jgi:hypothetical protein
MLSARWDSHARYLVGFDGLWLSVGGTCFLRWRFLNIDTPIAIGKPIVIAATPISIAISVGAIGPMEAASAR